MRAATPAKEWTVVARSVRWWHCGKLAAKRCGRVVPFRPPARRESPGEAKLSLRRSRSSPARYCAAFNQFNISDKSVTH
jgi:hypothetical protein|uniref:Uncharacterized protein n=1 Tax=Fagus sylvatica TaxID=28930 RepID=A0A2N9G1D6_FAGSY